MSSKKRKTDHSAASDNGSEVEEKGNPENDCKGSPLSPLGPDKNTVFLPLDSFHQYTMDDPPLWRRGRYKQTRRQLCVNPTCRSLFASHTSLQNHYAQSPTCLAAATKPRDPIVMDANGKAVAKISQTKSDESDEFYAEDDASADSGHSSPWVLSDSDDNRSTEVDPPEGSEMTPIYSERWEKVRRDADLGVPHNKNDRHETELLKLLDDAYVPHAVYQKVLRWAKTAFQDGYQFNPQRTKRSSQIKHLTKMMNMYPFEPIVKSVRLPPGPMGPIFDHIKVTTFDFTTMLMHLLQDPVLTIKLSNLDLNPSNPFSCFVPLDGRLSVPNSGGWYRQAYHHCVEDPSQDFLCPIIFAIDESTMEKGKKASACPVMMTSSIFNINLRKDRTAWRPIGYLYDLDIQEDKTKHFNNQKRKPKTSKARKNERAQAVITAVLESMVQAQSLKRLNNLKLELGPFQRLCNLKVPVMFIIGDMQGGDKLCGSYATYSNTANRPCRKCNVKGKDLGNPDASCHKISMQRVLAMIENKEHKKLKDICQHPTRPAFCSLDFGGCKFGLFSAASPVEPLHSMREGLIKDCLDILFKDDISGSTKHTELDQVCKTLAVLPRQRHFSSDANAEFPRLRWKEGISNLTGLSAAYREGKMLTMVVLSLTNQGRAVLDGAMGSAKRQSMQYVFQMMLCYCQWLRRPSYWRQNDKAERELARDAIRRLLKTIVQQWPRMKGNGWDKPKIHEQLHVPDDIHRHGAPEHTNTQRTENHHIQTKRNYQRTQKRRENQDYQLAKREYERICVNRAILAMSYADEDHGYVGDDEANEPKSTTKATGSKFSLRVYKLGQGQYRYQVMQTTMGFENGLGDVGELTNKLNLYMAHYIYGDMPQDAPYRSLRIYTEEKRHDQLFRAHHNFQGEGQWYDWVMVRWEGDARKEQPSRFQTVHNTLNPCSPDHHDQTKSQKEKLNYCYAPAKLLFFVEDRDGITDERHAFILPCEYHCLKSSVFSTKWKLVLNSAGEPLYDIIPTSAIVSHVLMIPEDLQKPNSKEAVYHEIWTCDRWSDLFHVVK